MSPILQYLSTIARLRSSKKSPSYWADELNIVQNSFCTTHYSSSISSETFSLFDQCLRVFPIWHSSLCDCEQRQKQQQKCPVSHWFPMSSGTFQLREIIQRYRLSLWFMFHERTSKFIALSLWAELKTLTDHSHLMSVGHFDFWEYFSPLPLEQKCPSENAAKMEMSDRFFLISRPHPLEKMPDRTLIVNYL